MRSMSNILTHNNLEHLSHAELTQLYLYGQSNLGKTLNCKPRSSTSMIPSDLQDPN